MLSKIFKRASQLAPLQPGRLRRASVTVNGTRLRRFAHGGNAAYRSLEELLGESIPAQRYRSMDPMTLVKDLVPTSGAYRTLDIGCGNAKTRSAFKGLNDDLVWQGIEIAETYNISDIADLPDGVQIYDGVNIPFEEGHFDLCFSGQVFEHVRHPEDLLDEVRRVLKPGRHFVGSLSGGEPYHWHSLFNFTALGWKTVLEDHGFKLRALYSGIDALTLLLHHWSENRKDMGTYFRDPILIDALAQEKVSGAEAIRQENALKLAFAGHLVFDAERI
ncbi:MAG: class I SAM-dependent methyltransferase [Pseudomonadota bacterium]|nr:class I SAM-dependent methyltransferase [Pseudomonadota bacterium]